VHTRQRIPRGFLFSQVIFIMRPTTFLAFGLTLLLPILSSAQPAPTTRPAANSRQALSPWIRPAAPPTTRPVDAVHHAIVISIDGLRPDLMLIANTPNLHSLMQRGVYSMWARTTPNSITLPSHVSMMTGVNPRRHDIEWSRDFDTVEPLYPRVPTLFEAAKRHGYTTAVAAGKRKFDMFDRPGVLDWRYIPTAAKCETADVVGPACEIIREHKPDVMLIHFPSVDNVGHAIGWATPQQMKAIEDADAAVGQVLQALEDANLTNQTLLIVTSDHGGAGQNHGPDDARSRHIPWIAVGPGIRHHVDLTTYAKLQINTEDTFATVCWMMGIPPTLPDLDGVPVKLILEQKPKELLRPAPAKAPPAW
jgi:predicted AlkP superfamily pyrophosphatase or phosphodiesterase